MLTTTSEIFNQKDALYAIKCGKYINFLKSLSPLHMQQAIHLAIHNAHYLEEDYPSASLEHIPLNSHCTAALIQLSQYSSIVTNIYVSSNE